MMLIIKLKHIYSFINISKQPENTQCKRVKLVYLAQEVKRMRVGEWYAMCVTRNHYLPPLRIMSGSNVINDNTKLEYQFFVQLHDVSYHKPH